VNVRPVARALLEAVFVDRLQRLAEDAAALETAADAGEAFFGFFARVVDQAAVKKALTEALAGLGVDVAGAAARSRHVLRDHIAPLLVRAQDAGAVRSDLRLDEMLALLVGASHAAERARSDERLRVRVAAVVIDGMRASGSGARL
jgi:hypothetical protein